MLLPVRKEVCDPPAAGVKHAQLGGLLLKQSLKQDPGIGSCGVQVLEDVVKGQVYCNADRLVGSVGELHGVSDGFQV